MHLLYARFFTKAMRDLGVVDFDEPFLRLFNQGTVLSGHAKMSKSRGNVIAPDDYVAELGADVVRLYLMFMGPWEGGGDWSDSGINGVARWVNRLWDQLTDPSNGPSDDAGPGPADREVRRALHQTLRQATQDFERFKYNTAIAAMMSFTNVLAAAASEQRLSREAWDEAAQGLLLLLAPLAPHLAEEMWERLGQAYSIHQQPWPEWGRSARRRRGGDARRAGERQAPRPHHRGRGHQRGGREVRRAGQRPRARVHRRQVGGTGRVRARPLSGQRPW